MWNLIKWLFQTEEDAYMFTVDYRVRITTADGYADLTLNRSKQLFVPRDDDTLYVIDCPGCEEESIYADVTEVVWAPVREAATVYAETDLDFTKGHKIDCLVKSAQQEGWELDSDIKYHGCCPQPDCPGKATNPCEESCVRKGCDQGS